MDEPIPRSIPQLWHRLDRRLLLIEEAQRTHTGLHEQIKEELDDHEQRLRAAGVPGMVLPPMRWEAPEGVRAYPAPGAPSPAVGTRQAWGPPFRHRRMIFTDLTASPH